MADETSDTEKPPPLTPPGMTVARSKSLLDYRQWLYNELSRTAGDVFGPIETLVNEKKWDEALASLSALPQDWQLDPEAIRMRTFVSFMRPDEESAPEESQP